MNPLGDVPVAGLLKLGNGGDHSGRENHGVDASAIVTEAVACVALPHGGNVDTCARVCHSPTGYGLKNTLGESAGTQTFTSVMKSDVIVVIGANPTDGHPVFGSQMKRRLRQGAKLIVIDPRVTGLVHSPHIQADYHLQLTPGTNVAMLNALSHVIVTEGLTREDYAAERCEPESYAKWKAFVSKSENSPAFGWL